MIKKINADLKKMPLIFSITKITNVNEINKELRKVVKNDKYFSDMYPVFPHFKNIIRF